VNVAAHTEMGHGTEGNRTAKKEDDVCVCVDKTFAYVPVSLFCVRTYVCYC